MLGDYATSKRIAVVVDDDDLVLSVTSALLEDLGFETVSHASAESALAQMHEVDGLCLLLTDCRMPGMSGEQLIRKVLEHHPDLPIILASGNEEDCADFGARVVHLPKPYGRQDLIRAIGESAVQAKERAR